MCSATLRALQLMMADRRGAVDMAAAAAGEPSAAGAPRPPLGSMEACSNGKAQGPAVAALPPRGGSVPIGRADSQLAGMHASQRSCAPAPAGPDAEQHDLPAAFAGVL